MSIKIYPDAHRSFDSYVPIRRMPEARQGWARRSAGMAQRRRAALPLTAAGR